MYAASYPVCACLQLHALYLRMPVRGSDRSSLSIYFVSILEKELKE
jgi:hypothetical protein